MTALSLNTPSAEENPWFVVRVKSNFEHSVANALHYTGFNEFLPTYKSRRRWSDRVKDIDLPLFPGYVFCQFRQEQRATLLKTPGVVNVLSFGKALATVPQCEIAAIRRIVESEIPGKPWPFLKVGQNVAIAHGPLAGLEGLLVEFKGGFRVVVSITLLQRSVAAEVDGAWVRALPQTFTHRSNGFQTRLAV
jgi:transcription antitermination factor NusG